MKLVPCKYIRVKTVFFLVLKKELKVKTVWDRGSKYRDINCWIKDNNCLLVAQKKKTIVLFQYFESGRYNRKSRDSVFFFRLQ